MSKIGYARVSSKEQNLDRQLEALQSVSKVFSDKASGQSTERPQLQAMLDYLREGDIVIVTELDRLGRNNKDLNRDYECHSTKRSYAGSLKLALNEWD